MYRIQLASGDEAVFRSLEELAVGVQNRIVGPDALVYHRKTGSWLPIEVHPHYHVARELVLPEYMRPVRFRSPQAARTKSAVAAGRSGPTARAASPAQTPKVEYPSPRRETPGDSASRRSPRRNQETLVAAGRRMDGPHHLLRTLSGILARGPSDPGRPRPSASWLMAAAVSGVATVGLFFFGQGNVDTATRGLVAAGMEAPRPTTSTRPGRASATTTQPLVLPSSADGGASYGEAYRQAGLRFEEGIASLEFENLFATARISTADSLRIARRLVAAARNVLTVYRSDEVRIDQAFAMADASMREPYGTARSVDSLFAAVDSIYGLLLAAQGRYRLRRGRIAFDDPLETAAYVGQAIWLEARLRDWNRNPARTPMTIRPLVAAVGRVPRSQTGF